MLDPESPGPVGRSWAWSGLGGTAPLTGVPTCCRKGLTFVSVHDCFWTHAADVAVMNQVPAPPSPWSSPRRTLQPLPQSACWSQRSPWGLGQGAVTLPLRPLFRLLPSRCAGSSLSACTASPSCTTCPGSWWNASALAPGEATSPPPAVAATPSQPCVAQPPPCSLLQVQERQSLQAAGRASVSPQNR